MRRSLLLILLTVLLCFALPGSPAGPPSAARRTAAPRAARRDVDPGLLAGMAARSIGPAGMSGRVTAIDGGRVQSRHPLCRRRRGRRLEVGQRRRSPGRRSSTTSRWPRSAPSPSSRRIRTSSGSAPARGTRATASRSATASTARSTAAGPGATWGSRRPSASHRIVLHPTNPDVAWVAALGQAWGENPERGVFKTEDGGKSWTRCSTSTRGPAPPTWRSIRAIPTSCSPRCGSTGAGPGSSSPAARAPGSTSRSTAGGPGSAYAEEDGLPKGDLGRIGIAVSRSNPEVVYAHGRGRRRAPCCARSDGGRTWQTVNDRYDANPRPFYFAHLAVDPAVAEPRSTAWTSAPGLERRRQELRRPAPRLARSTATTTPCGSIPHDPDTWCYVGNDGGVAISHDRGETGQLRDHPAARPVLPRGGRQDRSPTTSTAACRTTAPGAARAPPGRQGGIRNHDWAAWSAATASRPARTPPIRSSSTPSRRGASCVRYDLRTGEQRGDQARPPDGREAPLQLERRLRHRPASTPARSTSAASSSTNRPTAARPGRRSART